MFQNALHRGGQTVGLVLLTVSLVLGGRCMAQASSLRRTAEVLAIEQARPSVVNIHGRKTINAEPTAADSAGIQQVNGMGTGIVVDPRGYIVTNYHVVEGVSRIQVTTATGRTVIGELVAHDAPTDLAILKIQTDEPMPVIRIGSSFDLMTGEPVIAIGNAYGYTHTVTRGIISALHRPIEVSETQSYQDLIQTDASINPGNSGGPLLNIDGEMIGINVAVRMGAQGIGFALPVDEAMEVVSRLLGELVMAKVDHGLVGETSTDAAGSRFTLMHIAADSPAYASGLRNGDLVVAIGDQLVSRELDCQRVLLGHQPGDEVPLTVVRSGEEIQAALVLGEPVSTPAAIADRAWFVLGLRLTPATSQTVRKLSSRYNGGMKVTAVRSGSPAAREGIRGGDILVGLHKWETISLDNIAYILDSDEFTKAQPAKFYILRGAETLYGQLRVSQVNGKRY